jgi:hypothetical protein
MKVRFHKKLYAETAVQAAVAAFAEVARVTVASQKTHVVADIQVEPPNSEIEVAREFSNYVLGETIANRGEP